MIESQRIYFDDNLNNCKLVTKYDDGKEVYQPLTQPTAARVPILCHSEANYTISMIPLNYRIWIKRKAKLGVSVDHDLYTRIEDGLDNAKRVAEETLKEYFQ